MILEDDHKNHTRKFYGPDIYDNVAIQDFRIQIINHIVPGSNSPILWTFHCSVLQSEYPVSVG
jgi:hypothetical protein